MKIRLYDFDFNNEIAFIEGSSVCLTVDNRNYFIRLMRSVKGFDDGTSVFAVFEDKDTPVYPKDYLVVTDYYEHETVTRTVLTKTLKNISDKCNKDDELLYSMRSELTVLHNKILNVLNEYDIQFDSNVDCPIEDVLKLFSVAPVSPGDKLIDKYLNLLELSSALGLYKLIVFVNARSFFDKNELNELQKCAAYKNLRLLFIENKAIEEKNEYEEVYSIDNDLFLSKNNVIIQ